jgi:hypothetical protein
MPSRGGTRVSGRMLNRNPNSEFSIGTIESRTSGKYWKSKPLQICGFYVQRICNSHILPLSWSSFPISYLIYAQINFSLVFQFYPQTTQGLRRVFFLILAGLRAHKVLTTCARLAGPARRLVARKGLTGLQLARLATPTRMRAKGLFLRS